MLHTVPASGDNLYEVIAGVTGTYRLALRTRSGGSVWVDIGAGARRRYLGGYVQTIKHGGWMK